MPEYSAPYATLTDKKKAAKVKNHIRGLIKSLENQCDATTSQLTLAEELKTDLHVARLQAHFNKCEATVSAINDDVCELTYLGEPDDSDIFTVVNSWRTTFKNLRKQVNDAELAIERAKSAVVQQPAAQSGAGLPVASRPTLPKANDLLKPRELQLDDKPSVLRLFKRKFQDYYETNNMQLHPCRIQQNYFLQCVSTRLETKLRHMMRDVTPVLAVKTAGQEEGDSCYKMLDDIFKAQYPMVRRRQEFFNYMQAPNQKCSEYMDKLQDLFDEAEFEKFDPQD